MFFFKGKFIFCIQYNKLFLIDFFAGHYQVALLNLLRHIEYLASLPIVVAGVLGVIDLIPRPAHDDTIKALQAGKLPHQKEELSDKKISVLLESIMDDDAGTVLGVSKYTGSTIIVPDHHVNQVALVLGTTGSGKTITLRRFYHRAIKQNYPLIIVDGKPDETNINWLMGLAKQNNRAFYGFNCGNYQRYNPLADGGYTELKDKIISLKDEWSSDYYRSIAEDYLQATFEVLLKSGESIDLKLSDAHIFQRNCYVTNILYNPSLII